MEATRPSPDEHIYRTIGLLELPKVPRRLFLPMGTIKALFED
jgi:hypothetical protein